MTVPSNCDMTAAETNVRLFTTEYLGPLVNNQREGAGEEIWFEDGTPNHQKYKGQFLRDTLHGQGQYIWSRNGEETIYEGSLYSSNLEGYGRFVRPDGTVFEGLFKNNARFGPGVDSFVDSTQTVGLWYGNNLIRLCQVVKPEWVPKVAHTSVGKAILLRYKKLVTVCNGEEDIAREVLKSINAEEEVIEKSDLLYNRCIRHPKSTFFNRAVYDSKFFSVSDCYIDITVGSDESICDVEREIERAKNVEYLQSEWDRINSAILEGVSEENVSGSSEQEENDMEELCAKRDLLEGAISFERSKPRTKKVLVTELLAWNNEDISIEIMKHAFLHRNFEKTVSYLASNVLVGNRTEFNQSSAYEADCVAFLSNCSSGHLKKVSELLLTHDLNPDMCDAMGNSGMMYAAARDRRQIIRVLVNFGANVDVYNDECLTPLSLCILRYLAVQNDVVNWELAFLKSSLAVETDLLRWRPHESLVSLSEQQKSKQNLNPHSSINLKFCNRQELIDSADLFPMQMMFKRTSDAKNLQDRYLQLEEAQPFLFNTDCIKPPVHKSVKTKTLQPKKKLVVQVESEPNHSDILQVERLNSIRLTISTLLDYGADPNEGEVPMPILLSAIFTKNIDIVEGLLAHKADCNARTLDEELTALHILVSLPPWDGVGEMAKLLLAYGANPNLRATTLHWLEEKETLVGKHQLTEVDEGKTPLHLLSMRYDFTSDTIGELAQILIAGGAKPSEYYLGHTPLSLAVLRGNIKLINSLMESGKVDPNQLLGEEMGVALGVLILKRYTNLPRYEDCEQIIQSLVYYGANPFNSTGPCGNLMEFMAEEFAEPTPKGKRKPKQVKGGKETTRVKLKAFLENIARFVLDKHIKGWVVQQLYHAQNYDDEFAKNMAHYVPVAEVVDLAQALFYRGEIRVKPKSHSKLRELVEFIAGVHPKSHLDVEKALENFDYRKLPPKLGFLDLPQPQVERHSDKYDVCYHCHKKQNRQLFRCPKCKVVYFCSEECNLLSNAREKWGHPCKVAFYSEALRDWKAKEKEKMARDTDTEDSEGGYYGAGKFHKGHRGRGSAAKAGKRSTATTGKRGAATTGKRSAAASGKRSAATTLKTRKERSAQKGKLGTRKGGAASSNRGKTKGEWDQEASLDSEFATVVRRRHRLPKTYQCFLEKIAIYWPELDLSALFVPYACYNNGQLYYRFHFQNVVFGETYSLV
ncbi:hypothetical protein PPYR_12729 [Photinus pyralis]|uniref:MYND-type domain-containing protein n=2 Tax=Photinus pyralis TaxID=7054 RepID=A0A5N4A756_PHOPY|nr:uncharacterized protein LOC116178337 [Photinus pyralis]KAB0793109.1 hypothetical protein PPYR_12729 [Photinus pyralis]